MTKATERNLRSCAADWRWRSPSRSALMIFSVDRLCASLIILCRNRNSGLSMSPVLQRRGADVHVGQCTVRVVCRGWGGGGVGVGRVERLCTCGERLSESTMLKSVSAGRLWAS